MSTITELVEKENVATIRGVLIDPANKTVEEVKLHKDMLFQHMYELMDCDLIERIVSENRKLQINLDEEGLYKSDNKLFIFYPTISVYPDPFVGKAIVTGYDFESLPEDITLDFIKASIEFIDKIF